MKLKDSVLLHKMNKYSNIINYTLTRTKLNIEIKDAFNISITKDSDYIIFNRLFIMLDEIEKIYIQMKN